MKLPDDVKATRDRYVETFPLWVMDPGPAAEERARTWTLGFVSQVVYEHPGQGYGSKRADPGRPISKDALAQQQGATLLGWDLMTGAGGGSPTLNDDPDSMNITGQVFEPIVGADVIGGAEAPGAEGPPPEGIAVIPYDEAKSVQFGHGCNAVYAESGANVDAGMISVHSQRAAWDYYVGGLSWDESYRKHINEFRAVYGLAPV